MTELNDDGSHRDPRQSRRSVCIVGAGPRGTSVLERICANANRIAPGELIDVQVIDPYRPGPGRIWRTDQSPHLLMNTVTSQVTLFTDASVTMDGPVAPGPSLYEWARTVVRTRHTGRHDEATLAEAHRLAPDDYPTRAFYGRYLAWVFHEVGSRAPRNVSVFVHQARVTGVTDTSGPGSGQCVHFEGGGRLDGMDAVVLALGHVDARPLETETELADFAIRKGLVYIPPGNPADINLFNVRARQPVIIRGLGLSFFDYLALLTVGRGGSFERSAGRLGYRPSGLEPVIHAGSRRGVPYQARGENEKGRFGRHQPAVLTPEVIEELRDQAKRNGGLDFRRDVWPLVAAEVEGVYYTALLKARGLRFEVDLFHDHALATPRREPELACLLDEYGVTPDLRWDWERIAEPHEGRPFGGTEDFRTWLLDHLDSDVAAAHAGNISGAMKGALDVLRDLRNEVRQVVDHCGLSGDSYRDDLDRWFTPLNAYLSIGPPVSRVEEMIALIQAGVLTVIGPGLTVAADPDNGTFAAASDLVPGSGVSAIALIEARLPSPDLRRTADPLLLNLLAAGECDVYRIGNPDGRPPYETGGLAVTKRPYHLLNADGCPHPRRFAFGVPTEAVHWATAAGARPGVDSVTFGDSDAIATAVLSIVRAARCEPSPPRLRPMENGDIPDDVLSSL